MKGNLLDVQEGIIAHGCNCIGVMGAGVAAGIKAKYPNVFHAYKEYLDSVLGSGYLTTSALGKCQIVKTPNPNLRVANLFTQLSVGGHKPMSYDALDSSVRDLFLLSSPDETINMPKIGAGLGGGNWNVIERIILEAIFDFNPKINVIIWVL